MSHMFDIAELRQKIFLVQNLIHASEPFVKKHCIGVKQYEELYDRSSYLVMLKSMISSSVVEISIKLRSLDDSMKCNDKSYSIDHSPKDFVLCICGDKEVSFRESCNKIIHADGFYLDIQSSNSCHEDLQWWGGFIRVQGFKFQNQKNEQKWEYLVSLYDWCNEALRFINKIEPKAISIQVQSEDVAYFS
ncbi:hypothetical protein [Shewanella putrefaciens]|uniref:Uncharacterized protein n=1 Tax=Shewanella putrefaciens (strain CN-32 / ATCC BAA-453) TaxID=319224 RepID=A4Y9N2_SHEPC|nr:hypothetical protein [Shewanella putrefaciens]QGS48952.1 hypothetical protein FOB89_08500 [Shewanella putrefaciens]